MKLQVCSVTLCPDRQWKDKWYWTKWDNGKRNDTGPS